MARGPGHALPQAMRGSAGGADLHLTPDGRFLYTNERASSLLTLFGVSPKGWRPHPSATSRPGPVPGLCHRLPSGHWLIATGQQSHGVALHAIDPESDQLTPGPTGRWARGPAMAVRCSPSHRPKKTGIKKPLPACVKPASGAGPPSETGTFAGLGNQHQRE